MVTIAVFVWPCGMFRLDGFTVIVKSCAEETDRPMLVECEIITADAPLLPDPVNVMG
jgi:hypothetical protein